MKTEHDIRQLFECFYSEDPDWPSGIDPDADWLLEDSTTATEILKWVLEGVDDFRDHLCGECAWPVFLDGYHWARTECNYRKVSDGSKEVIHDIDLACPAFVAREKKS